MIKSQKTEVELGFVSGLFPPALSRFPDQLDPPKQTP